MPRETLDRQIHHLQEEVLLFGSMVEQAMLQAVEALKQRDLARARQIYRDDRLINEKRYAIENAILILMATQQPMARDLRLLAAILEVITELERMGDYAKGIARVCLRLGERPLGFNLRIFDSMTQLAVGMLHRALGAFINENAKEAFLIAKEDDQVDERYNQVYRQLVESMIADPSMIDQANLLLWVAHNIERMADRVTNICERTVFIATGEVMELDVEDVPERI